jgi:hypothetical protein
MLLNIIGSLKVAQMKPRNLVKLFCVLSLLFSGAALKMAGPAPAEASGAFVVRPSLQLHALQPKLTALDAVYEDPQGFYTLRYPKKWIVKQSGSEMQFWADRKTDAAIAVSMHVKALSADQLSGDITALFRERQENFKQLKRWTEDISGYAFTWVDERYTVGGVAYKGFYAAGVRNRVGFVLVAWAPEKSYASYDSTFRATARSLAISEFDAAPAYDQWLVYQSKHISFHYLPKTYVAEDIQAIARQHEQVYSDVVRSLKLSYSKPITYFLYPSAEALYRATARDSGHANNEAGEVHAIWVSEDDHQSLGHEMTHIITSQAIGEPSEALLGEGIAVCMDHSGKDYHAIAADLKRKGQLIPLDEMLGDAWFEHDADVAYPQSGSFACFLLKQYGVSAFKKAYVAQDFNAQAKTLFKADLPALEKRWLDMLAAY